MGRHEVAHKAAGSGVVRVWAGRGLLLATGVGAVMGGGAGLAAAETGPAEEMPSGAAMTQEYDGPAVSTAPSLEDVPSLGDASSLGDAPSLGVSPTMGQLPALDQAPSADQLPSLHDAPINGESLVRDLAGSEMQSNGSVSESDTSVSGSARDTTAEGSMNVDGGLGEFA